MRTFPTTISTGEKRRRAIVVAILLLSIATAAGCGKKAMVRTFYLIELPQPADTAIGTPPLIKASCEILPVVISPAFSSARIALRTDSHELTYYFYHRWAIHPEEQFTHLLEIYLQNENLFASVSSRIWDAVPIFQIAGQIRQLEIVENEDGLDVRFSMTLRLIDKTLSKTLVSHSFDTSRPLPERDVNLFASEISDIYHEELAIFAGKLGSYLSSL